MELNAAWAEIAAALLSIVCGALGTILWFLFQSVRHDAQSAKSQSSEINNDLAKYKLYVAEHYVTQSELTKAVSSLERSIERLITSVDNGAKETREAFEALRARIEQKADK